MSLDNIDDLFSEQPLKFESKEVVEEEKPKKVKKEVKKDRLDQTLSKKKFGFKKIVNFFVNIDIKYYITIMKLAIIILLFVFSYFMVMKAINKIKGRYADTIDIEQTLMVSNNTNYTFLGEEFYIDGKYNVLQKMKLDTLATKFYFEKEIDRKVFTPILIDERGKYYLYDNEYIKEDYLNQDVIVFEGLDSGIENFRLIFTKDPTSVKENIDTVFFDFRIKGYTANTPVKYFTEILNITDDDKKLHLQVQNATFSSAVSDIVFSVYYDNENVEYDFSPEIVDENVYLRANGKAVTFRNNTLKSQKIDVQGLNRYYDEIGVGKLSFSILKNLDANLTIGFKNFFRVFRPETSLDLRELFLSSGNSNQIFDMDEYTVYFEGARKYDSENLMVLVAHAIERQEDTVDSENEYETDEVGRITETEKIDNANPFENHKEIIVDATLKITLNDGEVVEVQGEPIHNKQGTDILFRSENIKFANSANSDLVINKVTFVEEGAEKQIALRDVGNKINPELKKYIDFAESAVLDRLRYKASEIVYLDLEEKYTHNILVDDYFLELYKPLEFEKRPNFTTNASAYAFDNDGNFLCVVEEELVGDYNGWPVEIRNKHELVIRNVNGTLKVVKDKVLK